MTQCANAIMYVSAQCNAFSEIHIKEVFQSCFPSELEPKCLPFLLIPPNPITLTSLQTLDLWVLSLQVVSRGSQFLRAGLHGRHAWLLPLWHHLHTHQQPALHHHGLLSSAAQQAQQEPERNQGQQGSRIS